MLIYKYRLQRTDIVQPVKMPIGARVISFGLDPLGNLCIWAIVDPEAAGVRHRICVVMTGQEVPPSSCFVGTCTDGRAYVLHCFDLGEG